MRDQLYLRRMGRNNHHHIIPKSRKGTNAAFNLIVMDIRRHNAFHLLFQNRTFAEAAQVLLRAERMKKRHDNRLQRNQSYQV